MHSTSDIVRMLDVECTVFFSEYLKNCVGDGLPDVPCTHCRYCRMRDVREAVPYAEYKNTSTKWIHQLSIVNFSTSHTVRTPLSTRKRKS